MQNAQWKPIAGFEGLYEVSNHGEVKSIRNNIVLKQQDNKGYKYCKLSDSGRVKNIQVHRLVYAAFVGELDESLVVDHGDEIKANNYYGNLQQIPTRENTTKGKTRLSGHVGVHWYNQIKKWGVEIQIENVRYFLGVFLNKLEASEKYEQVLNDYLNFGLKPIKVKEGFKVCRKCDRELPITSFHTTKTKIGTLSLLYQCKECEAKYKRQRKFQSHEKNINSLIGCLIS